MHQSTDLHHAYLLTGTNLQDREMNLQQAIGLLNERAGVVEKQSPVYVSAAWGIEDQPEFLNQVLYLSTSLSPTALLECILEIELDMGRVRHEKWSSRLIDIDILFYDDLILKSQRLTIPHPYLQERRFTLAPLAAIAPDLMHPVLHQTVAQLLAQCEDPLAVTPLNPSYS